MLAVDSMETVMSETLEQKLAKTEQADDELRRYFARAISEDQSMYFSDFIIFGALKRTLALSDGFRGHIRSRNFTCAAALTRLQLDTALRLYAADLYGDTEKYAQEVFHGKHVNKLKNKSGEKLTDSYLADKLSEQYPWVKRMYENLCDFVHLSNRHFVSSIASLNEVDRSFRFEISAKDAPRPDTDYFEIVEGFLAAMQITLALAAGWHKAMHQKPTAA
jgi:hypothetical protein